MVNVRTQKDSEVEIVKSIHNLKNINVIENSQTSKINSITTVAHIRKAHSKRAGQEISLELFMSNSFDIKNAKPGTCIDPICLEDEEEI